MSFLQTGHVVRPCVCCFLAQSSKQTCSSEEASSIAVIRLMGAMSPHLVCAVDLLCCKNSPVPMPPLVYFGKSGCTAAWRRCSMLLLHTQLQAARTPRAAAFGRNPLTAAACKKAEAGDLKRVCTDLAEVMAALAHHRVNQQICTVSRGRQTAKPVRHEGGKSKGVDQQIVSTFYTCTRDAWQSMLGSCRQVPCTCAHRKVAM
jgi:hypothetical protein